MSEPTDPNRARPPWWSSITGRAAMAAGRGARTNGRSEFAVIGLGRFGSSLALSLAGRGHQVLGIDSDAALVQRYADELTQTVALDATDQDALHQVDITSFDTVVVAIGTNFEANLMTTLALKELGARHVICKAVSLQQRSVLLRIGADRVVLPEYDAGRRLAEELLSPGVIDYLPLGPGYSVTELTTPASFVGRTIGQTEVRRRYGVTIVAIKRGDSLMVAPPADYAFAPGDVIVMIGANDDISAICNMA